MRWMPCLPGGLSESKRPAAEESYNHLEEREYGTFPNYNREFIPVQCQHCDNPPCVKVCPTGASYKRKDGIVLVNKDQCIGCKYCLAACPYNVRIITKEGYIEKCRFCSRIHRKRRRARLSPHLHGGGPHLR